jgi:hypothetical protein
VERSLTTLTIPTAARHMAVIAMHGEMVERLTHERDRGGTLAPLAGISTAIEACRPPPEVIAGQRRTSALSSAITAGRSGCAPQPASAIGAITLPPCRAVALGDELRPVVEALRNVLELLVGCRRLRPIRKRARNIDCVEVLCSPEAVIRTVTVVRLIDLNRTFALCCAKSHRRTVMLSEQSESDHPPNPPESRSRGAERMARHRRRRRDGMRCVTVELRATEINKLIRCGLLAPASRADPFALRIAVHAMFDQVFR